MKARAEIDVQLQPRFSVALMRERSAPSRGGFVAPLVGIFILVMAGCGASPSAGSAPRSDAPARSTPTRLVAAVKSDPAGLQLHLTQPSQPVVPGLAQIYQLVNAALGMADDEDAMQPQLAEA